jgi:hypothetical protein
MFSTLKVKDLKKLVSAYRKYHNIKGYSKMKKIELVNELEKRFVIKNNQLFLKPPEQKLKKRITPEIIGQLGSQQPQLQRAFQNIPQSNRMRRVI